MISIILWILLGALAGWIASMIVGNNGNQGVVGNIIVGILGAFVGGFVMHLLGHGGSDLGTFNLYSILVAIGGAVLVLFLYRALMRRA